MGLAQLHKVNMPGNINQGNLCDSLSQHTLCKSCQWKEGKWKLLNNPPQPCFCSTTPPPTSWISNNINRTRFSVEKCPSGNHIRRHVYHTWTTWIVINLASCAWAKCDKSRRAIYSSLIALIHSLFFLMLPKQFKTWSLKFKLEHYICVIVCCLSLQKKNKKTLDVNKV